MIPLLTLLLVSCAAAGTMMDKILPSRTPSTTTNYPKPSKQPIKKPSYHKGAGTFFYTTPPPSYKTEAPEYYTTEKPYSSTPLYPKKSSYSSATPLYYKSTTPASAYKPSQSSHESTPAYSKVPKYYSSTTTAPKYHAPSSEAPVYHAAHPQHTTEAINKNNPAFYEMPSRYPIPAEVAQCAPAVYTTTQASMVYYDQPTYAVEAPVYYVLEEEPQYSVQEAYPAEQDEYYPPEQQEYAAEMQPNGNAQLYYTDSLKYPNEEAEYHSVPGYYTTPAAPVYYSNPGNEYYPSTTPSYGKNQY